MSDLDKVTGVKDSRKHIGKIAKLIGTKFRNQRLLLKSGLLEGLDEGQRTMVEWFFSADPEDFGLKTPFIGIEEPNAESDFEIVERMLPNLRGQDVLDIQYVPKPAYEAYVKIKEELLGDVGGKFDISSGYRSPAFQVLVLCYWIVLKEFDITGTLKTIALPGYTEHGLIKKGAIDFKLGNDKFLSAERAPKTAQTPEYKWLVKHAGYYGFELSYPEGNSHGMAFEPWHWRYQPKTG